MVEAEVVRVAYPWLVVRVAKVFDLQVHQQVARHLNIWFSVWTTCEFVPLIVVQWVYSLRWRMEFVCKNCLPNFYPKTETSWYTAAQQKRNFSRRPKTSCYMCFTQTSCNSTTVRWSRSSGANFQSHTVNCDHRPVEEVSSQTSISCSFEFADFGHNCLFECVGSRFWQNLEPHTQNSNLDHRGANSKSHSTERVRTITSWMFDVAAGSLWEAWPEVSRSELLVAVGLGEDSL